MSNSNKEKQQFLLIELLKKFSKKELKGLRDFVLCRYFNTDQYVVKLLEVIENEVIGKAVIGKVVMSEAIQARIYAQVFGEKQKTIALNKKQKATFNAKMNALTRLAERFLTVDALADDEAYKSDLLLKTLLKKQQARLFMRYINKLQKQEDIQRKGSDYHYQKLKISQHLLNYHHYLLGNIRKADNLNEQSHALDLYYLLNKLDLHLTAYSMRGDSAKNYYDFLTIPTIETLLDSVDYQIHPLIEGYLIAIELTQKQQHKIYEKLFTFFDKHEAIMPADSRSYFYATLVNFCIRQTRKGKTKYHKNIYELYRMMDEKNLLLENNIMPPEKLKNIISIAGRAEEYDWGEEMIEKYYPHIVKSMREDIRNFNTGAIAFYRKDYNRTKEHFSNIKNRINPIYDINLRIITAKYSYELSRNNDNKYDTYSYVLSRLKSIEGYISSSKSLKNNDKESHRNFMRILINLFRIKHSEGKMTPEKVKKKLESINNINSKNWLEEKIKELESQPV